MATGDCIESPRIWGRFAGKRPLPNGQVPEFWITDLTEEWDDEVIHHMKENFIRDAALMRSKRLFDQPDAVQEILTMWRHVLGLRNSLVALTGGEDGKPVLAGCNLLAVKQRGVFEEIKIQNALLRTIQEAMRHMESAGATALAQLDPEGSAFLAARGLAVAPAFRGQGVALHLLRARVPLCRALGLRVTTTVFVGDGVQKLAARAGFQLLAEVPYKEYRDSEGGTPFANVDGKSLMYMALPVLPLEDSQD